MLFLSERSGLKIDAVIGIIFTAFFGLGLFLMSLWPMAISVETIVFGNILSITPYDMLQLVIIAAVTMLILLARWKDLMVTFFDENHARSMGLKPERLKLLFFMLLSASVVAAMQTVGAFLVIAMVITPGATAYLICDRFPRLVSVSVLIGVVSSVLGTYLSYFIDGATGGVIVTLQMLIFFVVFIIAPKHGLLASRRKGHRTLKQSRES
jgi:manganese/iron transport system permease protein